MFVQIKKSTGSLSRIVIKKFDGCVAVANLSGQEINAHLSQLYAWGVKATLGSKPTLFDKALDQKFIENGIGGKFHRLFDGGHDVFGAWGRVAETQTASSNTETFFGYVSVLIKDFVTPMGLPFITVSKEAFEKISSVMSSVGISKTYLYSFLTLNAAKLTTSIFSSLILFRSYKKKDYGVVSENLGAMSTGALLGANPILLSVSIISIVASRKNIDIKKFAVGSTLSVISFATFSILTLPFYAELAVAFAVSIGTRHVVLENKKIQRKVRLKLSRLLLFGHKIKRDLFPILVTPGGGFCTKIEVSERGLNV